LGSGRNISRVYTARTKTRAFRTDSGRIGCITTFTGGSQRGCKRVFRYCAFSRCCGILLSVYRLAVTGRRRWTNHCGGCCQLQTRLMSARAGYTLLTARYAGRTGWMSDFQFACINTADFITGKAGNRGYSTRIQIHGNRLSVSASQARAVFVSNLAGANQYKLDAVAG
jgi:hypothetical protein